MRLNIITSIYNSSELKKKRKWYDENCSCNGGGIDKSKHWQTEGVSGIHWENAVKACVKVMHGSKKFPPGVGGGDDSCVCRQGGEGGWWWSRPNLGTFAMIILKEI